jgi:hypothetical protein
VIFADITQEDNGGLSGLSSGLNKSNRGATTLGGGKIFVEIIFLCSILNMNFFVAQRIYLLEFILYQS